MTDFFRSIVKSIRNVFIFMFSFTQLILPGVQKTMKGGENAFFEQWSAESQYKEDYAYTLEKKPNKDFVILNITDIQMIDNELNNGTGSIAKGTIDKLVADTKPDLITVTGDNAWETFAYIQTANLIDSYGIPWAPVMGNHDGEGCPSEFWCAKVLDNCKNCLFKFGPEGMGYGNYIINIKENDKIIHTLFMMDSHNSIKEDNNVNGPKDSGYDHFWPEQLKWYEWAVNGIKELAGKTVQSTVFMHIPVVEYKDAWDMIYDSENDKIKDEYKDTAYGVNHEGVCCAAENNGFFDLCKKLGSTKDMVCGHDHNNNYSAVYQGIRLTFALKTGSGCYWEEELNGGTVIKINSDGQTNISHMYVDYTNLSVAKMPIYTKHTIPIIVFR